MSGTKFLITYLIIILSIVCYGCHGGNADSKKDVGKTANGKPKLVFEKEMYNFGEIKEGDIIGKFIRFKNEGKGVLLIKSVDGSCDCLDFRVQEKSALPNEQGKIEVIFDSEGFHGRQVKFLKVVSNDSLSSSKELMIFADIK